MVVIPTHTHDQWVFFGGNIMKRNKLTEIALLLLAGASFIGLANCGESINLTDKEFQLSDSSDLSIAPGPLSAYSQLTAYGSFIPYLYIETNCDNGHDDNGNGLVDCEDPDCHIHPECSEFGPPLGELYNTRAITIYPNGVLVPEDLVIAVGRGNDDDDLYNWQRNKFFQTTTYDCVVDPYVQDPYYNIPLGEGLVDGPYGPVGPLLDPAAVTGFFGPRAGGITECGPSYSVFGRFYDDDDYTYDDEGRGVTGHLNDDVK